jgi:hypothetical protein
MTRARTDRKARFEAALKLAGLTAADWAKGQGVTSAHLHYVLKEERESARLEKEIEEFTDKYLGAAA